MHAPLVIVGTGAVARALGSALHRAGATIAAVAGRDPARAVVVAAAIGDDVAAAPISAVPSHATHVLIATTDARIPEVARELADAGLTQGIALHTSGATGAGALSALTARGVACAVFHPLQTVTAAADPALFNGVTFAVSGQPAAVEWAAELAATLRGRVIHPRPDRMAAYHASAVLAANGLAALLDASLRLMAEAGVEEGAARTALAPLMRTALDNALTLGPEASVTGPVVRGDVGTIRRHVASMIEDGNAVLPLYRAVSEELLQLARRRGLPDNVIGALAAAIRSSPHESTPDV